MMNSGPVARWLETFVCTSMCKQYVDVFQEFGFNNLNDICNLSSQQLLKMGVTRMDIEKIMENVSVLKQTMQATTTTTTVSQNFQSYSSNQPSDSEIASLVVNQTKPAGKKKATSKAKNDRQHANVTINQVVPNPTGNKKTKKNAKNEKTGGQAAAGQKQQQPPSTNDSNYIVDYTTNISIDQSSYNNYKPNDPLLTNMPTSSTSKYPNQLSNNNSYEFQNSQYQYQQYRQQPQSMHYPHSKSPTTLLSPISNPSSTSSISSSSSSCSTYSSLSSSSNQALSQSGSNHYGTQAISKHLNSSQTTYSANTSPGNNYKSNGNNSNNPSLTSNSNSSNQSTFTNYTNNKTNNGPGNNGNMFNTNMVQQQQYYNGNNSGYLNTSNGTSNSNGAPWMNGNNSGGWNNNTNTNNAGHSNQDYYQVNSNGLYSNTINSPYLNGTSNVLSNSYSSNPNQAFQKSTNHHLRQQAIHQAQTTTNQNSFTNNNGSTNKNSPLEYLERLALLPECPSVDLKGIVNDHQASELNPQQAQTNNALNKFDDILKNSQKRNLNSDPTELFSSKKMCSSSNSNSPNFKSQNVASVGHSFANQRGNVVLNESPSSSSSTTSSTSSASSSSSFNAVLPQILTDTDCDQLTGTDTTDTNSNSNNIIDASNFDFLDYLPELNSTTIDQTITTATSFSNINISNADGIDLLDAAAASAAGDTDLSPWF